MLRTAASFTMALDAVGDPRVESSAAGPATLCAERSCGCKMPTVQYALHYPGLLYYHYCKILPTHTGCG
jgi:hypothetical protein